MLILAPVSSKDLAKDIPPILVIIMGAPRSLFLIGREFIMIELTVSLSCILLGYLWGVQIPLRNLAQDGICLMASITGMVMSRSNLIFKLEQWHVEVKSTDKKVKRLKSEDYF